MLHLLSLHLFILIAFILNFHETFYFSNKTEMTDSEKDAVIDVLNILEFEPSSDSDHREQLAVLVRSGKVKEMIGQDPTWDHVKRLSGKDVERYSKRYETSLSEKMCDAMVDTFLQHSCKSSAHFLPIDEGKSTIRGRS